MTALPANRKEFLQTVQALIQSIRRVDGCTNCSACQDVEDENTFRMIRGWDPQKELDNYFQSDLFEVLLLTKNFLSAPCTIIFYLVSSTTVIEAVKKASGKIR
jgi:quinol monooxygenase YgiN